MKKIVILILLVFVLTGCNFMHIEDTNGQEDFSVVSITDKDILSKTSKCVKIGSVETYTYKEFNLKINKFSGIEEIYKSKKMHTIDISSNVESGNFRIVLISNEKIKDININKLNQQILQKGDIIKIVGESAKFEITIIEK